MSHAASKIIITVFPAGEWRMRKRDVWASGSYNLHAFFSSTFSHSVMASDRVKVLSFRMCLQYLMMRYFSSWSATDECNGCGRFAYGYTSVMETATCRASEREDRLLQAALCGIRKRRLRSDSRQTEPDVLRSRWVEAMDGVPDLGAGGNQRWWRARVLSSHCAHSRRRYVSWKFVQL